MKRADPEGVEAVEGVSPAELSLRPLRPRQISYLSGPECARDTLNVSVLDHPLPKLSDTEGNEQQVLSKFGRQGGEVMIQFCLSTVSTQSTYSHEEIREGFNKNLDTWLIPIADRCRT